MLPMQVYLDEQPVELPGSHLAALLDAARKRLDGARVVVEVAVDGDKLNEQEITDRAEEKLGDVDVRLVTADPRELAIETLEQVRGRLGDAQELQQDAADLLQQDQTPPALQKVGQSVEAWLQVQQAVLQSAVLLNLDLDRIDVDGRPAHELTSQAVEQLGDVKTFIQANDTVALADALQYEWPETTAQWHRLIDALVAQIKA